MSSLWIVVSSQAMLPLLVILGTIKLQACIMRRCLPMMTGFVHKVQHPTYGEIQLLG
jgi:hypothetical protein